MIGSKRSSTASRRARFAGAEARSLALASVRATREGSVNEAGAPVHVIIGTPEPGERLGDTTYDGKSEIALFPGDLPENPDSVFEDGQPVRLNFLRFEPPARLERNADGAFVLPHIRLDRAIDYLIGDWLK